MSHPKENPRNIDPAQLSALVVVGGYHSRIVNDVLVSHGFRASNAETPTMAKQLCAPARFDLAIYDDAVPGALDLARAGEVSSAPRVCIGLVQSASGVQAAGLRLHFALQKPFTMGFLSRTVKAACGPIASNRRASFRHEMNVEAETCILYGGELKTVSGVRVVNLSHTGLCLHSTSMLPQGAHIELTFTLPHTSITVQLNGSVVWSHASGRAGVKFGSVNPRDIQKLEEWDPLAVPAIT
jgi:PilZ domain-containing protein